MLLKILTDDEQCARICRAYWRQDEDGKFALKVSDIAKIYDIKPRAVTNLVEQNAYVSIATSACAICKGAYSYKTRSEYQERYLYAETTCVSCSEAKHKAIADKKKDILLKIRQTAEDKEVDFAALDLRSTIYLLATIQALGNENLNNIEPLSGYPPCTLSADSDYDQKIIHHLIDKSLLLISMDTAKSAIELLEDDIYKLHVERSTFDLVFDQHQINELNNNFHNAITLHHIKQTPEFVELCREIQLSECLGLLKVTLKDYQLPFSLGDKTQQVFSQCIEIFSVAQIYTLIEQATRDAAANYMRRLITKEQAANAVMMAISRSFEQSLANVPKVESSTRSNKRPQSLLSRMIFNIALGTDDGGFKQPLPELIQHKRLLFVLRAPKSPENTN